MTKTEEREVPKYQTPWLFDGKGDPQMLSAEEWLLQEAEVHAALDNDDDAPDCAPHAVTLRAIVKEIRQLRKASVRRTLPESEDGKRLDWIIANTKAPDWDRDWPMIYTLPALNATDKAANRHSHPSVRDAIDAAMSSEHPTP